MTLASADRHNTCEPTSSSAAALLLAREPLRFDVPAPLVEDMGERRRDRRAQLVLSDRFS
jgi:hypothetical protein